MFAQDPTLPTVLAAQIKPTGCTAGAAEIRVLMPMRGPLRLCGQAISIELPLGRALTLHVQRNGVLRLKGVRLWLTLSSSRKAGPASRDYFLSAGQTWAVAAGQAWVAEPFAEMGTAANTAHLDWQPALGWTRQWQAALGQALMRRQDHTPASAAASCPGARV